LGLKGVTPRKELHGGRGEGRDERAISREKNGNRTRSRGPSRGRPGGKKVIRNGNLTSKKVKGFRRGGKGRKSLYPEKRLWRKGNYFFIGGEERGHYTRAGQGRSGGTFRG